MVSIALGRHLDRLGIRSCTRFGQRKCHDRLAGSDFGKIAPLLGFRTVVHQRRQRHR